MEPSGFFLGDVKISSADLFVEGKGFFFNTVLGAVLDAV
jgi:hypothetical protein